MMAAKSEPTIKVTQVDESTKPEFFPWLEAGEKPQRLFTKITQRFPVGGGLSLIGSALTIALSFIVLHYFHLKQVIDPLSLEIRPAAWLSTIVSMNSILLHIAISKGLNIAWWYRASRAETTMAELHNTWSLGNSVLSAVRAGKNFNYVALATVFMATIPINGILVQSALRTGIIYYQQPEDYDFLVRVSTDIPVGYSAALNPKGEVQAPNPDWQAAMGDIMSIGSLPDTPYWTWVQPYDNPACDGICNASVETLGFTTTCSSYTLPYNLPVDGSSGTFESIMLDVQWDWNATSPNTIGLDILTKPAGCQGMYTVNNCTLEMAIVSTEITVTYVEDISDATGGDRYNWDLTDLVTFSNPHNYAPHVNSTFNNTSELHKGNTRFGGIAAALESFYGSRITYKLQNGSSALDIDGTYAYQAFYSNITDPYDYTDDSTIVETANCDLSTDKVQSAYFKDQLLHSVQRTLLYVSVHLANDYYNPATANDLSYGIPNPMSVPVTVHGQHYTLVQVYIRRLSFWYASLGVTLATIIFIIPTYYGYWTLTRKTTLSPFETARVFHSPLLVDAGKDMPMEEMLTQVGSKRVHRDLLPSDDARNSSLTSSVPASTTWSRISEDQISSKEILKSKER